jgi:basic amino acid/polyamine antiporter, APA family
VPLETPVTDDQPIERLPRVLGPWMATAIIVGVVIGSGIFKKPHQVAQNIPETGLALLAWILCGILTIMGALIIAEIATLYPRAGGVYVFLREALGRWAGFLWGWVEFWIIRSASIAALSSMFIDQFHDVVGHLQQFKKETDPFTPDAKLAMTVALIIAIALVNARGTRLAGMLQVLITSIKVGSLVAIAMAPFLLAGFFQQPLVQPDAANEVVWPGSLDLSDSNRFGAALVGILFAYNGWVGLAPVAEDIRSPGRNIPIAFIVGCLCVMLLYVSANVAYFLVVPVETMQQLENRTVAAEFAYRILGPTYGSVGLTLASAAIMMSVFGALNASLLVGPRLLVAMGRDGLAPRALAHLHPRYETPALATFVFAAWSILLVLGSSLLVRGGLPTFELGPWTLNPNLDPKTSLYDLLTDYSMFGAIAFETLGVATIFVFRNRVRPADPAAYRSPFYPWMPVLYIVAMAAVLLNMFWTNRKESIVAVGFMGVGAIVYVLFCRKAVDVPERAIVDRDR